MKFIILGLPKTGKTMLAHTLNRIEGFRVFGEILVTRDRSPNMPIHPQKIIEDIRIRDQKNNLYTWFCKNYNTKKYDITKDINKIGSYKIIDSFLKDMIFIPEYHGGFKLHHHHIEIMPELKKWILDNEDVKIVHCDRKNKIKQALAAIGNRDRGKQFIADPVGTKNLIKDNEKRLNELIDWFEKSKNPYMRIYYEDMTGDSNIESLDLKVLKKFFKLNIPEKINVLTKKNTRNKVSENLLNYNEFKEYFKNTKFEKWID